MAEKQLDVLLYGLGAIGGFYAFILSRNPNVRLSVVARSNYAAVKADGLKIVSETHGEHILKPYQVLKSVSESDLKYDYIVCANKAISQNDVPDLIRSGVDEGRTSIVLIQNGVGNEEPFSTAFPSATILSCVTWVGARQPQLGVFEHIISEDMQIGTYKNKSSDPSTNKTRLDEFAGLLTVGKTIFSVVPDIQLLRWEKVVWNMAWNALTTLTLTNTHDWLSSSEAAKPMTLQLMAEAISVGKALGVPLGDDLADKLVAKVLALPPISSSMRADYEKGRPLEIEVILGYPVRKAKELGISVPVLDTIYTLLLAINKRLTEASSS